MCKNLWLFNFILHQLWPSHCLLNQTFNVNAMCYKWLFFSIFQVRIFDLNHDDPLKLSNIVGEAIVSCWSIQNLKTDSKRRNRNYYIISFVLYFIEFRIAKLFDTVLNNNPYLLSYCNTSTTKNSLSLFHVCYIMKLGNTNL